MSTPTRDALVEAYVADLRRAARELPKDQRAELVGDVEEHLESTLGPSAGEAEVRAELARLGDPNEIVSSLEAAAPDLEKSGRGALEWAAILLLLFGGIPFVLGWFVGVVLLWMSHAWSWKQKLAGTLIIPGGLFTTLVVWWWDFFEWPLDTTSQVCTLTPGGKETNCHGGPTFWQDAIQVVLLLGVLIVPIVMAVYLARSARRRSET